MRPLLLLLVVWPIASASAAEKPAKPSSTDWWSLKPLVRPAVPRGQKPEVGSQNPVDAFVGAKLAEKGLTQSPEAEPRVLIRRLYFDLLGLPPKPEEVDAFVRDYSPSLRPSIPPSPPADGETERRRERAFEALVDKLLASPHYGERWARHWLDVVHYGDTHGYDKDKPRPNAWPYRDYEIGRAHV